MTRMSYRPLARQSKGCKAHDCHRRVARYDTSVLVAAIHDAPGRTASERPHVQPVKRFDRALVVPQSVGTDVA